MKYEILGGSLPAVTCQLTSGEKMITESGGMCWMSPNMKMETTSGGGIGKAFGRMISGESLFLNTYTAMGGDGVISFSSCFPGSIMPVEIAPGKDFIVQKSGFLASEAGVELSVFFRKKFGAGLFGGEGFIMQRLSGQGTAFIEIDGYVVQYELAAGQSILLSTGHLAAMEATCSMDIQAVSGVKNVLFGGEGFFNTIVTGPGKVYLQTMPVFKVAAAIRQYIPTQSSSH